MAAPRPDPEWIAGRLRAAWVAALGGSSEDAWSLDPAAGFLAAGGHSLAAAHLIARLRADLGVDLPMSDVVADTSFAGLVDVLAARLAADEAVSAPPAAARGADAAGNADGPHAGRAASAPLSAAMRPLWTWHRLHPDSPAYNVVRAIRIDGPVRPAPLRAAMADLSARHEALRCRVVEASPGEPRLVVGAPVAVPLSVEVVRTDGDTAAVDTALARVAEQPFAMDAPPLWRLGLVRVPQTAQTWLILVMHHLIGDMRAADVVLGDLATAYAARAARERPRFDDPAAGLLEHLAHERALVGSPAHDADLTWWSHRLAGAVDSPVRLFGTGDDGRAGAGRTHTVDLCVAASDALDEVLRTHGLTPAVCFLTLAGLVLGAWSGQDGPDVVGLPSVRLQRPEDERLVGFLLDTLLLPVSLDRTLPLLTACRTVREAYAAAADHALPAYDEILDRSRLPRSPGGGSPLIRLWFNDMTRASPPATFGGYTSQEHDLPPVWALFGLALYLRRADAGYRLHLVAPALSRDADMTALLRQVVRAAERAAADPRRTVGEVLAPDGGSGRGAPATVRHAPAVWPTPERGSADTPSTPGLLRRHGTRRPDAVALSDVDGALGYGELDAVVDEVVAAVRAVAGPGAVIGVPARRDRRFVVRLLACWRAGVTAVLVDAQWPPSRRAGALRRTGATHAFDGVSDGSPREITAVPPAGHAASAGTAGGPAHALLTSGTTGDPLVVRTPTRLTEDAIDDIAALLGVDPDDRVSLLSGPAHDPVLRDVALTVRAGATLCVPPSGVLGAPQILSDWLRAARVTIVHATPVLLALACGVDSRPLPDLRAVVCGGSPLTRTIAEMLRARAPGAVIVNGYGCTETPQLVTAHAIAVDEPLPPTAQVPIGRPLPGRRVEIHASDGRPCDVGQLGELWVAAPHIVDGYVAPAGDDALRFATDAHHRRWFRTGDLARRDGHGRLHLAGRRDRQALVNGHRVTLEEIEAVTRGVEGVADAAAEVVGDTYGQTVHVWAQRATAAAAVTAGDVRAHLAAMLPAGVVPTRVHVVERLGLSENLKAVPPQDTSAAAAAAPSPPVPSDASAVQVRALAESVLGRPLDPATNFFDAGFTSTSLLQLSAELTAVLGRPVDPLRMFDHPNLSALTAFLRSGRDVRPGRGPVDLPRVPAMEAPGGERTAAGRGADRRQLREWIHGQGTDATPGDTADDRPPAD